MVETGVDLRGEIFLTQRTQETQRNAERSFFGFEFLDSC
jgi:hypothetical protein